MTERAFQFTLASANQQSLMLDVDVLRQHNNRNFKIEFQFFEIFRNLSLQNNFDVMWFYLLSRFFLSGCNLERL